MNITVSFNIKRYKTAQSKSYIDVGCTASVEASDSSSGDPNIFMMQKLPKNSLGESTCRFSHVADPVDMQDYPVKEDEQYAYFRTDNVTLRVRSEFQVQHIVQTMREEVAELAQALSVLPESEETFSQTFVG